MTRARLRPTIALALMALCAHAAAEPATVQQPRAFGHVLGDIVTQQVLLDSSTRNDELSAMPSTGRVNAWLERRPPSFRTDADGRRWLVLDYQVMNSPRALTVTTTPPLQLRLSSGKTLDVAQSPLSIGPLAPVAATDAQRLSGLQPDRLLAAESTAPLQRALIVWSALAVAVVVAWLGWWLWRNRRDAQQLPFAKAWARFGRQDDTTLDANPEAWRGLHRALDEAAGRVVLSRSVPELAQKAPHLRELQPQLEQFFQRSSDRFFSDVPVASPFSLRDLFRALYRAEKRHHR
jgi:mxaA protein